MSAVERNFVTFQPGDDVNELADGLLPELAERAGIEFEDRLGAEELGQLVGVLGKNKGLRDNPEATFLTMEEQVACARRARETANTDPSEPESINRSYNDPDKEVPEGTPRVITGAVANWCGFIVDYLVEKSENLTSEVEVHMPVGSRVMDLPTEVVNEDHLAFQAAHDGQYPTEYQFDETFMEPRLREAGYRVELYEAPSNSGEEIASFFVAKRPELFRADQKLSVVRTSISALQLLLQMRQAAREAGSIPELYMEAAGRPIAQNLVELNQPLKFQAPQPALRQVALDGKLLELDQLAGQTI